MKNIFSKIIFASGLLLFTQSCSAQNVVVNREVDTTTDGKMLLGTQTISQFQNEPYIGWYKPEFDNYKLHEETMEALKKEKFNSYSITVFLGTWCGDSHRDFPRFMKIAEALNYPENKLTIIAVNRKKESPAGEEALYNIQTNSYESDFSRLYQDVKYTIGQRSLILLFTNFETLDAVNRQMKYLRGIAKNHLLVIIFFKNAELQSLINTNPENLQEVYDEIIAEKFEYEKKLIIQELRKYGIYTVYTLPENLNIEVINKYLEIKARGIL